MAKGKRSPTAHRTPEQTRAHGRGYQATTTQKKRRAKRNAARKELEREMGKDTLRGKDVDHKRMLSKGGSNKRKNLRVQSVKRNRGRTR